ncbi:DUF4249 domain-containing protein [Flagellimonas okinawensis]|uniref:DUF4249 domain-containing protein n=1 Tax=Flagellimonas okinawensis TaxID=3031324 RepID=A0ABT5XKW4_9FLAO|nr:DUF4249 domain-containing protein [[Muricauda] okinawensis]MDF0706531.1 DUF4249 domain-containing protein [[Muricauda] okinawensis]
MFLLLVVSACVEPFDATADILADTSMVGALVVEANITDLETIQKVFLSRMQRVETDSTVNVQEDRLFNVHTPLIIEHGLGPQFESGAEVEIRAENGIVYGFEETEDGTYASIVPFRAVPNVSYQLYVSTSNNEEFTSDPMRLPQTSSIENIYAERMVSDTGLDGVGIFVDSSFESDGNKLFRYAYEETYKIIAPHWTPYEFEIIRDENEFVFDDLGNVQEILYPDVQLVPRQREEQVCYRTDLSTGEVLLNANILNGNRAERTMVRFIGVDNPIISHRYSILVKQRGVSREAFDFYEKLVAFSQSESLFSQVQPGSLEGNVFSVGGNVPVVGFFDVSTEVSERLYFNFEDLFPGESLPPYFGTINCENPTAPMLPNPERDGPPPSMGQCPRSLMDRIKLGLVEYYQDNTIPPGECEGPYFVVPTICGDCNVVGSNVKPDFWID